MIAPFGAEWQLCADISYLLPASKGRLKIEAAYPNMHNFYRQSSSP